MGLKKLSAVEKTKILDLYRINKDIASIATSLNRDVAVIDKFLNDVKELFDVKVENTKVKHSVIEQASNKLLNFNLSANSINTKINQVLKTLSDGEQENLTPDMLVAHCVKLINANDIMITKTSGGQKGIAIMTEAASQRGSVPNVQQSKLPGVYNIY